MLKEIKCDKFSKKIKDKTIRFMPGLNCVVGADDTLNSIGKSSLLMMVDFCFGGSDYANKESDILQNIGDHTIYFAFEFGFRNYYFSRETADVNHYFECDSFYTPKGEKKPIENLNLFLREHYFDSSIVSSFRSLINPFSRVYGKGNYDVNKPLKTFSKDTKDNKGINVLIDLFEKMILINDILRKIEQAEKAKKAWNDAKKYGVVYSSIKTTSDVNSAKAEIENIKREIESLVKNQEQAALVADEKISQADIDLKSEQIFLMRKRRDLSIRLNSLESMTGNNLLMTEEDRQKLSSIFPNVDLKPLSKINEFQKTLSINVNEEVNNQKKSLDNELSQVENRLHEINDTLQKNNVSPRISKTFLETFQTKNDQIKKLENQVVMYEKKKKVVDEIASEKRHLSEEYSYVLSGIEKDMNIKLSQLNNSIYSEKRFPPTITLTDFSHYTYRTPNDQGTGTEYKSLLLFDLAVLELTQLPFIIDDSMLFKNIWDEPVEGLFRLYSTSQKQIFIAIDRINVFRNDIQKIIKRHEVIRLGNGEYTLFGCVWSKE